MIINFVKKIHFILNSRFLQTDHAMPFAFRPVIFQRHCRFGPHNCEFRARWPGAGRALEGKGEEAGPPNWGSKNGGIFPPKNGHPKNCIRTFPKQPLAISCYRFFCHPNWGLLWWVTPPPQKWQVPFLVRMTRKQTRGSYFFEDPEIPTPPQTIRWENPPGSVGAMGIFGLEVDDW